MKPPEFEYVRPKTLDEAVAALSAMEWGARIIAGGQSLVPMLNLRLAPLIRLVDVSKLDELRVSEDKGDTVVFGASLRHGDFEDGNVPDATNGLMQRVASRIAYRAVRNRGTIGGSVSLADPSADWITVLLALEAKFRIVGPQRERVVEANDMFRGPYVTALEDHDVLESIEVPKLTGGAQTGYYKVIRKAGEYPITTASVVRDRERNVNNVVLGASTLTQSRLPKTSACLAEHANWSDTARAAFKSAYHQDMEDTGTTDDSYVLKLCETSVLRAAQAALEAS